MLPSNQLLSQISQQIRIIPNQRKESKRAEHYCLFLLGQEAGLRVSEAINFDLSSKTQKGLYRIKSKGKKTRLVYIPKRVISKLKKCQWKPHSTNRYNFYHFLKRIKNQANLSANTELTPHTLRRAFATYHAENGLPLPLLSKMLGHQSIRTTALYWRNIYSNDDDDTDSILAGKHWLEKPQPEPEQPKIVLDELPVPLAPNLPLLNLPPAGHLTKIHQLENQLSQIHSETKLLEAQNKHLKAENTNLQNDLSELTHQNTILQQQKSQAITEKQQIQQQLTAKDQTIKELEQNLTAADNNLTHEKQINHNLRQQLQTEREINTNLTQKNQFNKQNLTNLQNSYQQAIKDKETTQKQLNHLIQEIQKVAQQLHHWQKLNYYQQLEQQTKMEARILQREPPWKKT